MSKIDFLHWNTEWGAKKVIVYVITTLIAIAAVGVGSVTAYNSLNNKKTKTEQLPKSSMPCPEGKRSLPGPGGTDSPFDPNYDCHEFHIDENGYIIID